MAAFYQKFLRKHLDLSSLSVMRREDNDPYFCTPKGASIFGWAGVDGIHFCFVRGFGETVFAVSPMNGGKDCVHVIARDFSDFLRLLLASLGGLGEHPNRRRQPPGEHEGDRGHGQGGQHEQQDDEDHPALTDRIQQADQ